MKFNYIKSIEVDSVDFRRKRTYKGLSPTLIQKSLKIGNVTYYDKFEHSDTFILTIDQYNKLNKMLGMKVDIIREIKQIVGTANKVENKLKFKRNCDGYYYSVVAYNIKSNRKPCFIIIDEKVYNALQKDNLSIIYNMQYNYGFVKNNREKDKISLSKYIAKQHNLACNTSRIARKRINEVKIINGFIFRIYDYRIDNLIFK